VWPQAKGCNRFVLETRYAVLPSSIDSYGVLCRRKERVSPSVAKLTTCDATKRFLEMKKSLVQRKVLCESRCHEGDCEYCCLLRSGAMWSNRRVLTFQKNLLHPCFCTLVMRAVNSSEVAMRITQGTRLHFAEDSNLLLIMVCSRCASKKHSVSQKILMLCLLLPVCEDRSVGIATGYKLDGSGIESRWGRYFLHLSRPALRSTQPPVQ